ncbi:MAG: N-acetylmuramoyl-L-alanine amidase [Bacteroidales bacterium]|nr:N-acetylmuramoyl-L-alanine amidase [Bacteroidales bacterium]
MRKILIIALTTLAISSFAQIELTQISSYVESETSLNAYKIDRPVVLDSNGGYGFKLKTPTNFTSFAVGWDASTDNYPAGIFEIVFKVHKPGVGWSNWKTDEGFTNPGDTRSDFYQSNLMFGIDEYLHDSLEFYIHCPEGEYITDIYLILMDISKTINAADFNPPQASATRTCPELPAIIPRADWCGSYDACHNPTYSVTYRTPTHTVIHHGASPDSYTDGYAVVRSYWNYHVNYNGWSDIGYNYLVDKYGNLFLGRHNPNMPYQDVHAAHAGYSNTYSIGINFLGNSDAVETAPTTPQLQKCSEFLAWWYDYKSFDPLSSASILNQAGTEWISEPRICGHKDVNPGGTTCPGTTLYNLLPDIRTQTNQIILDCSTPSDIEPPTTSISTSRNWYNSEFETHFSDADNAGGSGVQYSFYQIMDFDGTEFRANSENGFFNDNFTTTIHPEWTALWGDWSINEEHLLQTNESSINTNIYASLTQEAGNIYLYHWQQKISGTGSNKRSGMHFFCSDPTEPGRLESYMVYLRADGNTAEIYKYMDNSYETTNGGFFTSGTYTIDPDIWYDVKVILNTITGEISLYVDDNLAATATDPSPLTTGNSISPRTGGCQTEYDDIKVYVDRQNTINVLPAISSTADIRYQSVSSSQEAGRIRTLLVDNANNWSESISKNIFTDFDAPTTSIASANGNTWQTNNFELNFTDNDALSGIEKSLYLVSDFNGSKWTANADNGFAYNSFDTEIGAEWTLQTGTWINSSGKLVQTDESNSNTNIYASLVQDLSNRYLYEFDLKISGSDANKRGGFHFFADNPTQPNRGNGYFVWFRWASQDLEFYKVTDDVFSLEKYTDMEFNADQWYNVKIIFDRITGETLVYLNDVLVGEYIDSEPFSSGDYVSFRSGNSNMSIDNFKVYRSRYPDVDISIGNSASDVRYQSTAPGNEAATIYSIVHDSAKNISAEANFAQKVDWTPPSDIITINDGVSTDIDITYNLTEISSNWTSANDLNSGIVAYYFSVGTSPGATDFINWTNNGTNTNFSNNSTTLIPGTTYYVNVKAENGAGLFSNISTSDGLLASGLICPDDTTVCEFSPSFYLEASPEGGTFSGVGIAGNIFMPSVAGPGTYTETYEYESQTCQFFITVNSTPNVICPEDIYIAVDDAPLTLLGANPTGGTYSIEGTEITQFDPATYGIGDFEVTYEFTSTPENCSNTCTFNIYVFEPLVLACPGDNSVCIYTEPFTLQGATPPGGSYTGNGVTANVFDPTLAGVGSHTISYLYDTETCEFEITVNIPPSVVCPSDISMLTTDSPITLSGGIPDGGTFLINGNPISVFDPQIYGQGDHEIVYEYTSTPDNCVNSCTFIITVSEPLILTCPDSFSVCENSTPFELTGATPQGGEYSGFGTESGYFNPSAAGVGITTITYTYETETCQYYITVNENPIVTCPENIILAVNDAPYNLQGGSPEGGEYSISGGVVSYINPPSYETGEYTIVYSYTNPLTGCSEDCEFLLTITPTVNIPEMDAPVFKVYPNPNNGSFVLEIDNNHNEIFAEIINMQGQIVFAKTISKYSESVEFNDLTISSGMYLLKLSSGENLKTIKMIVK